MGGGWFKLECVVELCGKAGGGGEDAFGLEVGELGNGGELVVEFFDKDGVDFPTAVGGQRVVTKGVQRVRPLHAPEDRESMRDVGVGEPAVGAGDALADEGVCEAIEGVDGGERGLEASVEELDAGGEGVRAEGFGGVEVGVVRFGVVGRAGVGLIGEFAEE